MIVDKAHNIYLEYAVSSGLTAMIGYHVALVFWVMFGMIMLIVRDKVSND